MDDLRASQNDMDIFVDDDDTSRRRNGHWMPTASTIDQYTTWRGILIIMQRTREYTDRVIRDCTGGRLIEQSLLFVC